MQLQNFQEFISITASRACDALHKVNASKIAEIASNDYHINITKEEALQSVVFAARSMIEKEPAYSYVASRIIINSMYDDILNGNINNYNYRFEDYLKQGIDAGRLHPDLLKFDIEFLSSHLIANRDRYFKYLGLQTLYDRYFVHINGKRIELPQYFFMRVAMGLALNEKDKDQKAVEFYNVMSTFDFMPSTPTLFNSGTLHPQLSSCFLTTIGDDLGDIFDGIRENALLSKFAGGLGNDWTNVRAMGSLIKGTNGNSQGVVPFLKVANDTIVAVNQGGKRKGAGCAYLETWHLDIEEFLELRKNTGDDRRRCHDMNTANWIPDLFMKRVMNNQDWTLFSPHDTKELHDCYGEVFEGIYTNYEALAKSGVIKHYKIVKAVELWRKMLSMLFETGHPWITFKDPCNLRSPQQHCGVVHSSNLCTEITLNTSNDEIAVCNLGSINLIAHLHGNMIDKIRLQNTIRTAMRMLDNVIDTNFYPVAKAKTSNLKHRPVGLGLMGFQDYLQHIHIPYASNSAVKEADDIMELISYYAIQASSELAQERGVYESYKGSLWSQGILPIDSIKILEAQRGSEYLDMNTDTSLNWDKLRSRVLQNGMRNSNCLAIAPTATIANIVGVSASIEPTFQNMFVKSNMSGEFTVINEYLIKDLKKLQLWDDKMITDIKFYDGSIQNIDRIPAEIKSIYSTAFEIDPEWLVKAGSRRQKWIDQAQSLNLYMSKPSGKKLDALYRLAWLSGLKTTYYLRTLSASSAEKSTGNGGELNAVSCNIDNPDCESCQ